MSLFEKIKNKRYDLIEKKDENISTGRKRIRNAISDLDATQPSLSKDISQRITAQDRQQQLYNRQYDAYDDGDLGNPSQSKTTVKKKVTAASGARVEFPSGSPEMGGESKKFAGRNRTPSPVATATSGGKTKSFKPKITGDVITNQGVNQGDVSKQAKEFTKKVNKQNKNLTPKKFFDPVKAKKAKDILIAKRKEYGIDRKGNISDAGVKRYALKTKQLSSGSNVPAKVTAKDLKVAKIRAVGGEKIKDSTGKVIGTTTGKYGGKLSRARNKNMPSYAEVKAKIDAKNPTYRSPITGGKLPNIGSPASQVKKLDPKLYKDAMKLKGKGGIPKWMKDFDKEYPDKSKLGNIQKPPKGSITEPKMPKTILKRVKPDLAFPKGFKPIDTGTKEGQKLYQKQLETGRRLSTKDLTAPTPPKLEPIVKPKGNLFSRLKTKFDNFGKGVRNYLKDPGPPGYRTYKRPDGTVVSTRNFEKNFYKRTFKKLSRKGKLGAILGAGIIGTSIVSSLLPKKGKGAGAKIPFDAKNYKPVTVKLSLTSGKKDKKGNIVKPPELPVNNNPNVKNLVNRTAQAKKNYKIPKVT